MISKKMISSFKLSEDMRVPENFAEAKIIENLSAEMIDKISFEYYETEDQKEVDVIGSVYIYSQKEHNELMKYIEMLESGLLEPKLRGVL